MRYYYIIGTDDSVTRVGTEKSHLDLDDCRLVLDCDWIERAKAYGMKKSYTMFFDEEGKFKDCGYNSIATAMYGSPYDCIIGTVVVTKTEGLATFKEEQCKSFEDELQKFGVVNILTK